MHVWLSTCRPQPDTSTRARHPPQGPAAPQTPPATPGEPKIKRWRLMAGTWVVWPAVSPRLLASAVWSAGGTCDPGRMIRPAVAVPGVGGVKRNAPLRGLWCRGRGIQATPPRRPLARRDLGTSDEPVLREQSRRAVASGAEAGTVAPGRATNLAGCSRPARSARRATRCRHRRARSAPERVSRPQRHRRRVRGAVVSELGSSQLGPRRRLIPTSDSERWWRPAGRSLARRRQPRVVTGRHHERVAAPSSRPWPSSTGRPGPPSSRSTAIGQEPACGSMFWFSRNTFVGSYPFFSATRRLYVSSPYDERAESASPRKLT